MFGQNMRYLFFSVFVFYSQPVVSGILYHLAGKQTGLMEDAVKAGIWLASLLLLCIFLSLEASHGGKEGSAAIRVIPGMLLIITPVMYITFLTGIAANYAESAVYRIAAGNMQFAVLMAGIAHLLVNYIGQLLVFYLLLCIVAVFELKVVSKPVFTSLVPGIIRRCIPMLLFYNLPAAILLYALQYIPYLSPFLIAVIKSAFMVNFIVCMVKALAVSIMLMFIFNKFKPLVRNAAEGFIADDGKPAAKSRGHGRVALLGASVLLLVLLLPISNAAEPDTFDTYLNDVYSGISRGDRLKEQSLGLQAYRAYEKAYSRLLSMQAYIDGIAALKEKDRNKTDESFDLLHKTALLDGDNPYAFLFEGDLNYFMNSKRTDKYFGKYLMASRTPELLPYAFAVLADSYGLRGEKEQEAYATNILQYYGIYENPFRAYIDMSDATLEKYRGRLKEAESAMIPCLVFNALEKMDRTEYEKGILELRDLGRKFPNNALISYNLIKAANFYNEEKDGFTREILNDALIAFDENLPAGGDSGSDNDKKLFMAQMHMNNSDGRNAELVLEELYVKNPGSAEIAANYAWTLLWNKKTDKMMEIVEKVLAAEPENSYVLWLASVGELKRQAYELSLEYFKKLMLLKESTVTDDYGNTGYSHAHYDHYLYIYGINCAKLKDQEFRDALEKHSNDAVLYNYIMGMQYWHKHKFDQALECFGNAVEAYPSLGYGWYMMGMLEFTRVHKEKGSDYGKALDYLLKAVELEPQSTEGYFFLGIVYDRMKEYAESARAFRHVRHMLPFQDHKQDTHGFSYHSGKYLEELAPFLDEEGE